MPQGPLISLTSDLRSLSYADMGSSDPLITQDLPEYNEARPRLTHGRVREDDLKRIDKLFKNHRGRLFKENLALLTASTQQGNGIGKILGTAGQTAKVIGATLAQVPVNGTGTRFVYGFNGFTYLSNPSNDPVSKFSKSGLGKFLKNNLGIQADGIKGAERALVGGKIITDNTEYDGLGGQSAYNFSTVSKVGEFNSKFDLKEGSTNPGGGLANAKGLLSLLNVPQGIVNDISSAASAIGSLFKKKGKGITSPATGAPAQPNEFGQVGYSGQSNVFSLIKSHDVKKTKKNYTLSSLSDNEIGRKDYTGIEHPGSKLKDREDSPSKFIREVGNRYLGQNRFNQPKEGDSTITVNKELSENDNNFPIKDNLYNYKGQDSNNNAPDILGGVASVSGKTPKDSLNPTTSKQKQAIEGGYRVGSPAWRTADAYIKTRLGQVDALEKKTTGVSTDYINALASEAVEKPDDKLKQIIPFEFHIIEPDESSFLYFRAYLDSLSDNYTGEWNNTKYVGRAESLYNYTGFKRDVSFAFKIAAESRKELLPIYNKLNRLIGATAPTYDSSNLFMRGTFVKLTLGDYFDKLPGFISNVSLGWDIAYPWEIDSATLRVPHILNVDVSYTPIHNNPPTTREIYVGSDSFKGLTENNVGTVGDGLGSGIDTSGQGSISAGATAPNSSNTGPSAPNSLDNSGQPSNSPTVAADDPNNLKIEYLGREFVDETGDGFRIGGPGSGPGLRSITPIYGPQPLESQAGEILNVNRNRPDTPTFSGGGN